MIENVIGFWDVTDVLTLIECEEMANNGVDVRFEDGRALIPVYDKSISILGGRI